MIAHPMLLVPAAEKAGIKVPKNLNKYSSNKYPHWAVFCNMQLGTPLPYWGCHWENAKVIAKIPNDKIMDITWKEVVELGFHVAT